jgi:pyridoxamine 5'-phosphate oxidase
MFDPTNRPSSDTPPFDLLDQWLADAAKSEVNDPSAVALASVAEDGFPSVRMVLLKGRDEEAVHFYTNLTSRKANEISTTGKAAMCFHWKSLRRQVRLVGIVGQVDNSIADSYYQSRPYNSQIGAWASDQSTPLDRRETLIAKVEDYRKIYPEKPLRPPHWGGFRLIPHEMEFWIDGEARLHDRFRFTKSAESAESKWTVQRLYP